MDSLTNWLLTAFAFGTCALAIATFANNWNVKNLTHVVEEMINQTKALNTANVLQQELSMTKLMPVFKHSGIKYNDATKILTIGFKNHGLEFIEVDVKIIHPSHCQVHSLGVTGPGEGAVALKSTSGMPLSVDIVRFKLLAYDTQGRIFTQEIKIENDDLMISNPIMARSIEFAKFPNVKFPPHPTPPPGGWKYPNPENNG